MSTFIFNLDLFAVQLFTHPMFIVDPLTALLYTVASAWLGME